MSYAAFHTSFYKQKTAKKNFGGLAIFQLPRIRLEDP
jgi:hypothetical protein